MSHGPITLVVARATNGVIGRGGKLPWHLPDDLRRFKRLTMGSSMIMGRRTFESLPGILPGRRHIVLTRDREWQAEGVAVVHDTEEAISAAGSEPIAVIGGAEIFDLFLPYATRIELTEVDGDIIGDTVMADPRDFGDWLETAREPHQPDGSRPGYTFITLERA